jgi:hypothetical protein
MASRLEAASAMGKVYLLDLGDGRAGARGGTA